MTFSPMGFVLRKLLHCKEMLYLEVEEVISVAVCVSSCNDRGRKMKGTSLYLG